MDSAKQIIAASPGFVSLRVERCLERPSCFLLLVEWDRLEDHTEGFRGSTAYQDWRAVLHHFYDPFPVVEHFETIVTDLDRRAGVRRQVAGAAWRRVASAQGVITRCAGTMASRTPRRTTE